MLIKLSREKLWPVGEGCEALYYCPERGGEEIMSLVQRALNKANMADVQTEGTGDQNLR